jgi:hypothetical protein
MALAGQGSNSIMDNFLTSVVPETTSTIPTPASGIQNRHRANPSISPQQPHASFNLPTGGAPGNYSLEMNAANVGISTRQNSLDNFFDLARVSSNHTSDSNDSVGADAEIDFESLWQWPSTGLIPGNIELTPGGGISIIDGGQAGMGGAMNVQGAAPVFGFMNAPFPGN